MSGVTFTIRAAAEDDVAAACVLVRRAISDLCMADHHNMPAIVEGLLINKTPENMRSWIITPGSFVFVAEAGPVLAGVGGLTGDGEITLLYVAPEFRFQGVSKALLAACEERARAMRLPRLRLTTSFTARQFFLDRGYEVEEEEGDIFGSADGCELRKEL